MNREEAKFLLTLCDKLDFETLMDLGAYLIACAFYRRKPTKGTKGVPPVAP